MNKWFAKELRRWRNYRGMSLSEVAKISGVCKGQLSKIENGSGNPSLETLEKLAKVFRIEIFIAP